MIDVLISSETKRAILTHLLGGQAGRFYVRGVTKHLGLPVASVQRELKRLEQAGLLTSYQEDNHVYYAVNEASQFFGPLKQALTVAPEAAPLESEATEEPSRASAEPEAPASPLEPPAVESAQPAPNADASVSAPEPPSPLPEAPPLSQEPPSTPQAVPVVAVSVVEQPVVPASAMPSAAPASNVPAWFWIGFLCGALTVEIVILILSAGSRANG